MDTLSSLRARVRALQRKLAPQLALLRLRRLAEEHCLQSSAARADRQPPPESPRPHPLVPGLSPSQVLLGTKQSQRNNQRNHINQTNHSSDNSPTAFAHDEE